MSAPANKDCADVDHITFANLERHDQQLRACPDWRTQDVATSKTSIGLTNYMHPAFEDSRFAGGSFNLQDTHQARLFASRLLEADCSRPFWWALMSGECMDDPGLRDREAQAAKIRMYPADGTAPSQHEIDDFYLCAYQVQRPDCELVLVDPPPSQFAREELTSDQITKTKADLRDLARYIHYYVEEDPNGSRCVPVWDLKVASPFQGSPSRIVISAEVLRKHSAAMEGDLICQAWASVSLGFHLLRLLSQAAVSAARSGAECNWKNTYRFDADPIVGSEIRMLEACTFGGVLRREQEQEQVAKSHYTINGADGVPGLWFAYSDFPGEHIVAMFGDLDSDEDEQAEQIDCGPYYHREWKVSFLWLLRLMTDTFWDNDVPRRGQTALTPPLEVGYVMRRDSERKYGPLHIGEIRPGVMPDGYSMLPRSYVMVHHQLLHESRRAILFGDLGPERMAPVSSDDEMDVDDDEEQSDGSEDNGSGSSGPEMTESMSDSDSD